ncbi:MAG: hypothetical protein ACRBEQ_07435 [Hyphomonas sp.]
MSETAQLAEKVETLCQTSLADAGWSLRKIAPQATLSNLLGVRLESALGDIWLHPLKLENKSVGWQKGHTPDALDAANLIDTLAPVINCLETALTCTFEPRNITAPPSTEELFVVENQDRSHQLYLRLSQSPNLETLIDAGLLDLASHLYGNFNSPCRMSAPVENCPDLSSLNLQTGDALLLKNFLPSQPIWTLTPPAPDPEIHHVRLTSQADEKIIPATSSASPVSLGRLTLQDLNFSRQQLEQLSASDAPNVTSPKANPPAHLTDPHGHTISGTLERLGQTYVLLID